jgi:hypothetical protein
MTDGDSGAEDRWAKVERLAAGVTDYGVAAAVRAYYRVYLPVGVVFLTAVGAFVSILIFRPSPNDWSEYVGLGMSMAGIGVFVGGLIYAAKRVNPLVRPKRQGAMIWLEKSERKGVRDQIFGRTPPAGDHLPALRGMAAQTRQTLALQLLMVPGYLLLCANQILLTFRQGFQGFLVIWIPSTGLFLGLSIMALWQFTQAGRFLDRTSPEGSPSPAS